MNLMTGKLKGEITERNEERCRSSPYWYSILPNFILWSQGNVNNLAQCTFPLQHQLWRQSTRAPHSETIDHCIWYPYMIHQDFFNLRRENFNFHFHQTPMNAQIQPHLVCTWKRMWAPQYINLNYLSFWTKWSWGDCLFYLAGSEIWRDLHITRIRNRGFFNFYLYIFQRIPVRISSYKGLTLGGIALVL